MVMIDPKLIDQVQLDLETAHAELASGLINPAVSGETKLLAAAVVQAGAEIALAIAAAGRRQEGAR
jgi:hypothetical protein